MTGVMTEAQVKQIMRDMQEEDKKKQEYWEASDERVLKAIHHQGLYERQMKRVKLAVAAQMTPLVNWGRSLHHVIQGFTGAKDGSEKYVQMFPKLIIKGLQFISMQGRMLKWMKRQQNIFDDSKKDMPWHVRIWETMRLNFLKLGSGLLTMTSLLAGVAVILGVVSLAVQGTESPLYELWQTFDGVEKVMATMTALGTVLLWVGGWFALIGVGVLGFVAVLSGRLSPTLSIIVSVLSAIALGVGLVMVSVPSLVALVIASVVMLLVLAYRFRRELYGFGVDLKNGIYKYTVGAFLGAINKVKSLWIAFKKWLGRKFSLGGITGAIGLGGSYGSGGGYADNSSTTININNAGGANSKELASEITRELTISKRQRQGQVTRGALP